MTANEAHVVPKLLEYLEKTQAMFESFARFSECEPTRGAASEMATNTANVIASTRALFTTAGSRS